MFESRLFFRFTRGLHVRYIVRVFVLGGAIGGTREVLALAVGIGLFALLVIIDRFARGRTATTAVCFAEHIGRFGLVVVVVVVDKSTRASRGRRFSLIITIIRFIVAITVTIGTRVVLFFHTFARRKRQLYLQGR